MDLDVVPFCRDYSLCGKQRINFFIFILLILAVCMWKKKSTCINEEQVKKPQFRQHL